jgi:hypothetical protein
MKQTSAADTQFTAQQELHCFEENEDDSAAEHEDVFHWHSDETRS